MFSFAIDHPIIMMTASMFLAVGAYYEFQLRLRPLIIPYKEIESMAAELLTQHGSEAGYVASTLIDRAEHRVDPYEQGRWRRVLKFLEANNPSS
jgi:hypothetical protein